MKATCSVTCLLFVLLPGMGCSRSHEAEVKRGAALVISEAGEIDLGLLPLNTPTDYQFEIKNVSPRKQRLEVADVTCACTKAALAKDLLEPGEVCRLNLTLKSSSPGPTSAKVVVQAGDADGPSAVNAFIKATFRGLVVGSKTIRVAGDAQETAASDQVLQGEGIVHAYASEPLDEKSFVFAEVKDSESPGLECHFGTAEFSKLRYGVRTTVPFALKMNLSPSTHIGGHNRKCSIQWKDLEEKFSANFTVFVDPLENYDVQPKALVLRVNNGDENSTVAQGVVELVPREGAPEIEDLKINVSSPALHTEHENETLRVLYRGPRIATATDEELVLRSQGFRSGEITIPVLLVPKADSGEQP